MMLFLLAGRYVVATDDVTSAEMGSGSWDTNHRPEN